MWPILVGNGGKFISDDGKKSMLDDPKTQSHSRSGARWCQAGYFTGRPDRGRGLTELFETGKAAMGMNGPWMTGGYTQAGLNYDVAPGAGRPRRTGYPGRRGGDGD